MTHIFLETGKKETNEFCFIQAVISTLAAPHAGYDIITVGGLSNLDKFKNKFQEHENDDERNLVIFDADTVYSSGGFAKRKQELLHKKGTLGIDFELFLFPNNADDGIFEDLLEHIVKEEHRRILDYFKEYERNLESCKDEKGNSAYHTPDQKARIYAYISAFKRTNAEQERFKNKGVWNFSNPTYWNMKSPYLNPLKFFLKENLPSETNGARQCG